jgi:pilus assembly protein CpaD
MHKRFFTGAFVATACTLLSGCLNTVMLVSAGVGTYYAGTHPEVISDEYLDDDGQRKPETQLVLQKHQVGFPPGQAAPAAGQDQKLEAFLSRVGIGYGDEVFLMAPIPEGISPEEASQLTKQRSESVARILARNDIEAKGLMRSVGETRSSDDTITVVVRRHVVTLPGCPDWTGDPKDTHSNQPSSNWSCATATNLGMMVADPGDLARGRQPSYVDGEFVAGSVERYRKGETAPLMSDVNTQETFESDGGFRQNAPSGSGAQ